MMLLFKKILPFVFLVLFINPNEFDIVENDQFLVLNGKPNAVIVLSQKPTRSAAFAAKELQNYIHKISGALLPITKETNDADKVLNKVNNTNNSPQNNHPNKIYVGQSNAVTKLQLASDQLKWGGYQIASGKNWLALVGDDIDFKPQGLYSLNKKDWNARLRSEWEKETNDSGWENVIASRMWNRYNKKTDLWAYDHKGSLNAVYDFLRLLGVRWFMPGDLGEHVPQIKSIALPVINEVKIPHYKIRKASFTRYGGERIQDDIMWSLRQGMNFPYGYDMYHGLWPVTRSEHNRKNHPEYYALYKNKRRNKGKTPEHCLSSQGLFQENLRYIRTMIDMYDLPAVSVMPDDGYVNICECSLCKGKDTPERGVNGKMSDYVWEYVNNIAIELEKTHPEAYVIGGAYSSYFLPPQNIDKLNPNVIVCLTNGRRRYMSSVNTGRTGYKFTKEERVNIAKEWNHLSDGKVINLMNFGGAANTPNVFAEDIKATQNQFIGEDMWVEHYRGGLAKKGFNHLNYYVSARLWWDPERDTNALLDEYYTMFYGPAAVEMKRVIDYFEVNQQNFGSIKNKSLLETFFSLFEEAKGKVDPNSKYAKRIEMFEVGLEKYKIRYDQMLAGRENVPSYKARINSQIASGIKVDGVLNENYWKYLNGNLTSNSKNKKTAYPTRFKLGYQEGYMYLGIESKFKPGQKLNSTSTKFDDEMLWEGDYVDILMETPTQSFYQISINPKGIVTDKDHSSAWGLRWDSEIEMASKVDEKKGVWYIEAKIPITISSQDPLHQVVGKPPEKKDFPWYFNICRKYSVDGKTEYSAFSPTGSNSFLVKEKFAELSR